MRTLDALADGSSGRLAASAATRRGRCGWTRSTRWRCRSSVGRREVVDLGGGMGLLAALLAHRSPATRVRVVEWDERKAAGRRQASLADLPGARWRQADARTVALGRAGRDRAARRAALLPGRGAARLAGPLRGGAGARRRAGHPRAGLGQQARRPAPSGWTGWRFAWGGTVAAGVQAWPIEEMAAFLESAGLSGRRSPSGQGHSSRQRACRRAATVELSSPASCKTDVLVIGAGPAGSVASALLARAGARSICLEAGPSRASRLASRCCRAATTSWRRRGCWRRWWRAAIMPKNAALFLRGEERERFCFAEVFPGQRTQTFQVPRARLRPDAGDRGAGAGRGHPLQPARGRGRVRRRRRRQRDRARTWRASSGWRSTRSFVLDCSGYGRVLPKLLEAGEAVRRSGRAWRMFTHVEGDVRPDGRRRRATSGSCIHPRGAWIWIIPFSNGRTSVGVVAERALCDSVPGCDREQAVRPAARGPERAARG